MADMMNPESRGKLLDILEAAGRSSRAQILEIREQRKGEQIGGAGHQSGTILSSSAPGIVLGAIKQEAIGKYDISQINIEFESSNFTYDFPARENLCFWLMRLTARNSPEGSSPREQALSRGL
jgi:hypothetical protein